MFIKDVSKDKPYRGIERKGILLSVLHEEGFENTHNCLIQMDLFHIPLRML